MITSDIRKRVASTYGEFFHRISKLPVQKIVDDVLSEKKIDDQILILCQSCGIKVEDLAGKKILEIGSGYGVFLAICERKYGMIVRGVESAAEGFESSFLMSKEILSCYGVDPAVVLDAKGENLPFADNEFDFIFSSTVLEHVDEPRQVLDEAIRVTKPGGFVHIIFPNHHAGFDGHYAVFHPPLILGKWFFPWWVKNIVKRDNRFAQTIRTELNVWSTKKILSQLSKKYSFTTISLGEQVFLERMQRLNFGDYAGLAKIKNALVSLQKTGLTVFLSRVLLVLQLWSPVIVTLRKKR